LRADVVGEDALDAGPELRGVVRLVDVRELVDDDVVDDPRGQEDGSPVEVQRAAAAAGGPAVAEILDLEALNDDAEAGAEAGEAGG
jgi:hypothetical protein